MLNNRDVFNTNVMTSKIDKSILSQLNMGYSPDGQMTKEYSSAIEQLASSYNEATAKANALKMAQDGLSESTVKDILVKQNWTENERNAAINSQAFENAQRKATITTETDTAVTWANVAATKVWSAAKKAASIIAGSVFAAALSIGISALINFIDSLHKTKKEIKEMAETAKQEIDDIKDSFDQLKDTTNDIKERYAELAQGVDQNTGKNLKLSTENLTINTVAIPWLDVNQVIEFTLNSNKTKQQYLINNISCNYADHTMSITANRFFANYI